MNQKRILLAATAMLMCALSANAAEPQNAALVITADARTGNYTLREKAGPAHLTAGLAASINGVWVHSTDYPVHKIDSEPADKKDGIEEVTILNTGLSHQPDMVCKVQLHSNPDYAEIGVHLQDTSHAQIEVQDIRVIEIRNPDGIELGGPESDDRILSDSFSEDRPAMAIHDLGDDPHGLYRGVGSQLIYNRGSRQSLFVAALTSDRWLTVLRLHASPQSRIASYEVDSTGTTELETENSLQASPAQDRIELSLPVLPGMSLSSEKIMVALGNDYHAQLENYGTIIRDLHHARVNLPTPMGWWSWTAYYFGLNEGAAFTNAQFLSEQLKILGYKFFHIDEGYQYARGEYTTENSANFPSGMKSLETKVQGFGLTPGIWTAPFEVSERSWLYQNHKDWLIHNAQGEPIQAGFVIGERKQDPLCILDVTNPGAQNYLRETYKALTRDWGIRYIKLDFMDDSAIEGRYFRPDTTAMEAQRIGLDIIRQAVGDDVILDKDGSVMLNPVGIVDCGRISQDTGHTFESSHDAATGIAARYYMNRNFFVSDPDAFTVSRQTVDEQEWHGGKRALTIDEARVSIALAAVSGGMFEIGDDLPSLFVASDRMDLVRNRDLIDMARLGRASTPVDLMTYSAEDEMPSVFMLHESRRQSILTVFNWTGKERQHRIEFSNLGLRGGMDEQVSDILGTGVPVEHNADNVFFTIAPRSVLMLKIIDTSVPAAAPDVVVGVPDTVKVGEPATFSARTAGNGAPAVECHWDFGDGTSSSGFETRHTFTHSGEFTVTLSADGIDNVRFENRFKVSATGHLDTTFNPEHISRRAQLPH